jgi:hypothetical protein
MNNVSTHPEDALFPARQACNALNVLKILLWENSESVAFNCSDIGDMLHPIHTMLDTALTQAVELLQRGEITD